ncbi:hypothetical protein [Streptomyces sp. NPDC048248]|uniref:hypothetical protein n=1 Tax=Streptomyces sp. NPDC048248 TaxID=3365523 RepID=UPI00371F9888
MPRNPKIRRTGATTAAERVAAAYRCSHCHSTTGGTWRDRHGIQHLAVAHDDGCPVLTGALPDAPDALRAAVTAGCSAILVAWPPKGGAA